MTTQATEISGAESNGRDRSAIEVRIATCGEELLASLGAMISGVPESAQGPQKLATALGIDKVLASRLLKALRADDALCAVHRMPGPEPLRRVIRASRSKGIEKGTISKAEEAVGAYERMISLEIGDRSALEAALSAWVPEARRDFQLRRKQSAYRATSQLKGVSVDTLAETAFLVPSKTDESRLDVIWMKRLVGLQRLRPNTRIRLSSFRASVEKDGDARRPLNLDGEPIESFGATLVDEFSTITQGTLYAEHRGETIYYLLSDDAFGPDDAIDLCTVEVNRSEIPRYVDPALGRVAWFSSELIIPARRQQLDVFVHRDLFRGTAPKLRVYDTNVTGIVDVNDPSSEFSELDLVETVEDLGRGLGRVRSSCVNEYHTLLMHVAERAGLDGDSMVGYRCVADYPFYGSQTAMMWPTVGRG